MRCQARTLQDAEGTAVQARLRAEQRAAEAEAAVSGGREARLTARERSEADARNMRQARLRSHWHETLRTEICRAAQRCTTAGRAVQTLC